MLYIICAMEKEARNIDCKDATIIITGVGLVNVIQNQINIDKNAKIINIGYAGSNKYPIGTVKSVSQTKRLNKPVHIAEPSFKLNTLTPGDICYTSDDFIEDNNYDIPLVDMELYYLRLLYPQIQSLKIVSDNLNYRDYEQKNLKSSWDLVNNILNDYAANTVI